MRRLLCLAALAGVSCSRPTVSPLRFHNQPVVWRVNDRANVPEKPADRPFVRALYHPDASGFRRVTRWLDVPEPIHALNVNALDEVPDSTWFENRIGVRDYTPAQIARGPNSTDGPDMSAPWQIKSSKVGGQQVGFIIKDARGDKYVLKFDEIEHPVLDTATDVVVQRLMWAVGYHVPEDTVVVFPRSQLVLADDASIPDVFGNKKPMTQMDLEERLAKIRVEPDGTIRGMVSKFVPGIPIGGFAMRGTRADDPNDTIPHQHRRELRGLAVFYSWLQCTDVKENNTMDVWEADPADENRHYVVHYLVDFGKSMGGNATLSRFYADGHAHVIDLVDIPLQILSFGLFKRAWEGTHDPDIEGVGMFDVEHYEPGAFVSHDPYTPFLEADASDGFWAAKILMRLSKAHIRAAVEQGKYNDPRAVEYLTETLVGRQRKAAAYWFQRVAPLDRFRVEENRLCFTDLALHYQLGTGSGPTTYAAAGYDRDGAPTGWRASTSAGSGGEACLDGFSLADSHDGYTMARIVLSRGKTYEPVMVHLARGPGGAPRIIGLRRY